MLENAEKYRIDIRENDDAYYFWKLRDPKRNQSRQSEPVEDKQECLDNLEHMIIRENWWGVPIYDENRRFLGTPEQQSDLSRILVITSEEPLSADQGYMLMVALTFCDYAKRHLSPTEMGQIKSATERHYFSDAIKIPREEAEKALKVFFNLLSS